MTNQCKSKLAGSLPTTWDLRTYDVWGNAADGYEVNDVYSAGAVELRIPQTRFNLGTPQEFIGAFPTDRQIKRAFGVNCRIDTEGDDLHITVNRTRDGYPIGEMRCTSHARLSPIRKSDLCPICGEHVRITSETSDGRLIGSCGDAFSRERWNS